MNYLPKRKFMSNSEWSTLLGLGLTVLGCSLKWSTAPPDSLSSIGAYYLSKKDHTRNAFDLSVGRVSVGWLIVIAAIISAAMLMLDAYGPHRIAQRNAHITGGVVIVALSILYFALQFGVLFAILGGALIVYGGLDRYRLS